MIEEWLKEGFKFNMGSIVGKDGPQIAIQITLKNELAHVFIDTDKLDSLEDELKAWVDALREGCKK